MIKDPVTQLYKKTRKNTQIINPPNSSPLSHPELMAYLDPELAAKKIKELTLQIGDACPRCGRPMRTEGDDGQVCWCCRNFDSEKRIEFLIARADELEKDRDGAIKASDDFEAYSKELRADGEILTEDNVKLRGELAAEDDRKRLEFLDKVNADENTKNGTKYGWRFDRNHNRSQVRLSDCHIPALTIREAIDAAMKETQP